MSSPKPASAHGMSKIEPLTASTCAPRSFSKSKSISDGPPPTTATGRSSQNGLLILPYILAPPYRRHASEHDTRRHCCLQALAYAAIEVSTPLLYWSLN